MKWPWNRPWQNRDKTPRVDLLWVAFERKADSPRVIKFLRRVDVPCTMGFRLLICVGWDPHAKCRPALGSTAQKTLAVPQCSYALSCFPPRFPQSSPPRIESRIAQTMLITERADRLTTLLLLCDPLAPQLAPFHLFAVHLFTMRCTDRLGKWCSCDAY